MIDWLDWLKDLKRACNTLSNRRLGCRFLSFLSISLFHWDNEELATALKLSTNLWIAEQQLKSSRITQRRDVLLTDQTTKSYREEKKWEPTINKEKVITVASFLHLDVNLYWGASHGQKPNFCKHIWEPDAGKSLFSRGAEMWSEPSAAAAAAAAPLYLMEL